MCSLARRQSRHNERLLAAGDVCVRARVLSTNAMENYSTCGSSIGRCTRLSSLRTNVKMQTLLPETRHIRGRGYRGTIKNLFIVLRYLVTCCMERRRTVSQSGIRWAISLLLSGKGREASFFFEVPKCFVACLVKRHANRSALEYLG